MALFNRNTEIRAIPTVKFAPQPKFLNDCARTLAICKNLGSFTCTLDVMPAFLPSLQGKEGLESIRFIGNFTTDQSEELAKLTGLREVTIDSSSWNVMDVLPRWMETLRPTLTSLTLNVSRSDTVNASFGLIRALVNTNPQPGIARHHLAQPASANAPPCDELRQSGPYGDAPSHHSYPKSRKSGIH